MVEGNYGCPHECSGQICLTWFHSKWAGLKPLRSGARVSSWNTGPEDSGFNWAKLEVLMYWSAVAFLRQTTKHRSSLGWAEFGWVELDVFPHTTILPVLCSIQRSGSTGLTVFHSIITFWTGNRSVHLSLRQRARNPGLAGRSLGPANLRSVWP